MLGVHPKYISLWYDQPLSATAEAQQTCWAAQLQRCLPHAAVLSHLERSASPRRQDKHLGGITSSLKINWFHVGSMLVVSCCFQTALWCCLLHRVQTPLIAFHPKAKPSTICLKPVHLLIKPGGGGNRITFHQGPIVLCPVHLVLPWQFRAASALQPVPNPFQEPLNILNGSQIPVLWETDFNLSKQTVSNSLQPKRNTPAGLKASCCASSFSSRPTLAESSNGPSLAWPFSRKKQTRSLRCADCGWKTKLQSTKQIDSVTVRNDFLDGFYMFLQLGIDDLTDSASCRQ